MKSYIRALERAILALSFSSAKEDEKAKIYLQEELRKSLLQLAEE